MNIIHHIVPATDWQAQEKQSTYEAASLQTEGFIHLSKKEQVAGTLKRYYIGVPDLLLLHIDADQLGEALVYEVSTDHQLFPHLYGPLPKQAVTYVEQLPNKLL